MFLIVGLGNPGEKYAKNRHNVGFMAAQEILRRHSFVDWKDKFQGKISTGSINGEKCALLMPMTYMNLSGKSVQAAAAFYKIKPENIIVLHDELDIAFGKVKFKTGGGNAGHNGLKSTQQMLGTPNFKRVRIGIGHPGDKDRVHGHVLGDFAKAEMPEVERMCDALADVIDLVMAGDESRASTDYALNMQ